MEFLLTKMKMSLIVIRVLPDFMKNIILIYFEYRLKNLVRIHTQDCSKLCLYADKQS